MDKALQKNRITDGSIPVETMRYFFPLVVGTLFQQAYNMVDGIIVGRFVGTSALAAIGGSAATLSSTAIQLLTMLFGGMSVIVSQYFGSKDEEKIHRSIHTMISFMLFMCVVTTAGGMLSSRWLLKTMDTPDNLMDYSMTYLLIYFGGSTAMIIYNAGASILRAIGDSKRPLYYLIVCCVANIVMDIWFVVYLKMGVAGAALATVIAQAISAVLVMWALLTTRSFMDTVLHISLKPAVLKESFDSLILRKEIRTGIPGMLQGLGYGITNILIQAGVNSFDTYTIAAWGAYFKVDAVYWAIMGAFGITATTFCGQNYGAGKIHRVFKIVRIIMIESVLICGSCAALLMFFARGIFGLYTTDVNVINVGVEMAYDLMPWYTLCVIIEVLSNSLRGLGDVKIPTAIVMGSTIGVRIPWLLFVVPVYHTLFNVIITYPMAWGISGVLILFYYFRRKKYYLANGGIE